MRKSVPINCVFGILVLVTWASVPFTAAIAHEAHKMECTETSLNAMNADIQAMKDGEPKTAAMKEMQMAGDMMAKKDTEGCAAHMHAAMEAMEE